MTIVLSTEDSPNFQTRSGLKTSISSRLDRTFDDDDLNDFIYLAEREMERRLTVPYREVETTFSVTGATYPLPADFKAVRRLRAGGVTLEQVTPASVADDVGNPTAYAIVAGNLQFSPVPGSAVSCAMVYEAQITPLTEGTPSNWLLNRHPDAYFYGALVQASDWIADPARISRYRAMFDLTIDQINEEGLRYRYNSAPLTPRMYGVV